MQLLLRLHDYLCLMTIYVLHDYLHYVQLQNELGTRKHATSAAAVA